jgi:hypothetical protein
MPQYGPSGSPPSHGQPGPPHGQPEHSHGQPGHSHGQPGPPHGHYPPPRPRPPRPVPAPPGPPPFAPPVRPSGSYIIDCLYSYTYVWPRYGNPFWFYPTRVEYNNVTGYLWTGRGWVNYSFSPAIIMGIACYPVPTPY